jgi:hypothetical protein
MSLTIGYSTFELGNEFMILKENLEAVSIRVFPPNTQEIKGTIWSSDGTKLGETETYTCKAQEWTMLPLKEAVTLESGKSYVVSGGFTRYYKFQDHSASSPECSIMQGKFNSAIGSFPTGTSEYDLYGIVDLVMQEQGGTVPKYLIRNDEKIYTIESNNIVEVSGELSSSLFEESGFDELPSNELLLTLNNPDLLFWNPSEEEDTSLKVVISAIPHTQVLVTNKIGNHRSILGIEKVSITCEGDVIMAVSFDEKQSWKAWTGTEWITVSDEFAGMSKSAVESITVDQWNELFSQSDGFYIRLVFINPGQKISKINIDFIN